MTATDRPTAGAARSAFPKPFGLAALLLLQAAVSLRPARAAEPRDLDLAFVLDTTGSMSGEIREAKERVRQVAEALAASRPGARVRLGVVAFRDRGDDYLTRIAPLTEDLAAVDAFLSALHAGGGGDGPEDLLTGLAAALGLEWDESSGADRQVFLVGDAPAHLDYADGPSPESLIEEALRRRIVLNAIGCRSLPADGVELFRRLAYATEGSYHHVGRVELGMERGASTPGLADAVVATLARDPERRGPTRRVEIARADAVAPAIGATLAVERLSADGACLLGVSLPQGLRLEAEPSVAISDEGLEVRLPLGSGQGESQAYELRPCPGEALPIRVSIGTEG